MAASAVAHGPGDTATPAFLIQPDDEHEEDVASTSAAGKPLALPPRVPMLRQLRALVRTDVTLLLRRTGLLLMLLLSPALLTLAGFGMSYLPVYLDNDGGDQYFPNCGPGPDMAALHSVPALFCVPLGFVFQTMAAVIVVSGEARGKTTRALVNLCTPITVVYLAWFIALALFASIGALIGAATGYASQVHMFKHTEFGVATAVMLAAALAHVAMGVMLGTLVSRVLWVHSLNLLILMLAITMLLIPGAATNADAFQPYTFDDSAGGRLYDTHQSYNGTCLTWPNAMQSVYAPNPASQEGTCMDTAAPGAVDTRGYNCTMYTRDNDGTPTRDCNVYPSLNFSAGHQCCSCGGGVINTALSPAPTVANAGVLVWAAIAWNPVTNVQRAFADVLSLQMLGGNSTARTCSAAPRLKNDSVATTSSGPHTPRQEHCTYSTANFRATREYAYFPYGHACPYTAAMATEGLLYCDINIPSYYDDPVYRVSPRTYEAPSASESTLVNVALALVYLVLALITTHTFPGDTGVQGVADLAARLFRGPRTSSRTAPSDASSRPRVAIRGATKKYGSKIAVNAVTATMREGEVFALLGHNGAGKTTLFQMLAGNLRMTSGTASVYGLDTGTDMGSVRRISSICSQEDILWLHLTGREHVQLYLDLRGQASSPAAVDDVLDELSLREVGDKRITALSGGMKRRLSVALASIGDAVRVMFYDEPTTGLDPINCRLVWGLLQRAKKGRIIVLTTHSMEEAELLADRIGVMNNGVLRAYGTPIYLKTSLGGAADKFRTQVTLAAGASVQQLEAEFEAAAPGSRVVSLSSKSKGEQMCVVMGVAQSGLDNLEVLFAWLNSSPLVDRWRVFNMSLEDVFARVGGRDQDPGQAPGGGMCGGVCSSVCSSVCCCCTSSTHASDDDATPLDLHAASDAVASYTVAVNTQYLSGIHGTATLTAQVLVVVAKNVLGLTRGSWKSLVAILIMCCLPVLVLTHIVGALDNDDGSGGNALQGVFLQVSLGLAPSLMLPWLVVVAVQDTANGTLELMVLQGLRIPAHVAGTFAYTFSISFATNTAVFVASAVSAAPFITDQSAAGIMLILLTLTCAAVWTGAVAVLLISLFKTTGMAAGMSGVLTLLLTGTALAIVTLNGLMTSHANQPNPFNVSYTDDDFFEGPYPVELSLAPYFGQFKALFLLGMDGGHNASSNGSVVAALALTLVQAAVFLAVGTYVYALRIANLAPLPTKPARVGGERASLLGGDRGLGNQNPSTQNATHTDANLGLFDGTRKVYPAQGNTKPHVALEGLNLAVQRGEFLGVLGPNGAGKSTAFNIMSGTVAPTGGDVTINGHSVTKACTAARRSLGSCPQHPRLWDDLTVADHLGLYAALRGLPSLYSLSAATRAEARHMVNVLATVMQLGGASLHKPARTLSGGMKRRLSLAIALVGCPPLTVLDEPTTGLDPLTRREVWNLLAQLQSKEGHAFVISTHSMEEADTLCSRIAIMAHGQLRVAGTQEQLKRQFGTGLTVQLTVASPTFSVGAFLSRHVHVDAAVKTQTGRVCNCHVPSDVDMATLFRALCTADADGHVQDWLVSETTLEDVFVRVVQEVHSGMDDV